MKTSAPTVQLLLGVTGQRSNCISPKKNTSWAHNIFLQEHKMRRKKWKHYLCFPTMKVREETVVSCSVIASHCIVWARTDRMPHFYLLEFTFQGMYQYRPYYLYIQTWQLKNYNFHPYQQIVVGVWWFGGITHISSESSVD